MIEKQKNNRALVAYFSHSGNTRIIAQRIREYIGGDIFEIVTVSKYPENYNSVVEQARKEAVSKYLPELKTTVENMVSYNTIIVGYPNWWGTIPRPIAKFLSDYDFSGKSIAAFCTHEGSGLGRSVLDIKAICPDSTILESIAIRGSYVKNAEKEISVWLHKIGMVI